MSARGTPALDALRRADVTYTTHEYTLKPSPDGRHNYGREAAAELGVDPARVFKTLIASAEERLIVGIVPVTGELDLKALADAVNVRRAEMADPAIAERATGYVVGGISPLGQRRRLPTVLDASALNHEMILVSAGRRGLQVELAPADLVSVLDAIVRTIVRAAD